MRHNPVVFKHSNVFASKNDSGKQEMNSLNVFAKPSQPGRNF
jgi:hypothetical protein